MVFHLDVKIQTKEGGPRLALSDHGWVQIGVDGPILAWANAWVQPTSIRAAGAVGDFNAPVGTQYVGPLLRVRTQYGTRSANAR